MSEGKKTFGQAVDSIVELLKEQDESNRVLAINTVMDLLGIPRAQAQKIQQPTITTPATPVLPQVGYEQIKDIKSLKIEKSPTSVIEMACVMAFYLRDFAPIDERRNEVSNEDIEKYFIQAGYPLPSAPGQTLLNAKQAGYFDQIGAGKYKLNPVGHNLVAHGLPKGNGSANSRPKAKSKAKASAKKAPKKKK